MKEIILKVENVSKKGHLTFENCPVVQAGNPLDLKVGDKIKVMTKNVICLAAPNGFKSAKKVS